MWCIMNRAQFNLLDDEAIARDYSPVFFFFFSLSVTKVDNITVENLRIYLMALDEELLIC